MKRQASQPKDGQIKTQINTLNREDHSFLRPQILSSEPNSAGIQVLNHPLRVLGQSTDEVKIDSDKNQLR